MEHTILLVEDSDEDYAAFYRVFTQAARVGDHLNLVRCTKGDEALDYLHGRGRFAAPARATTPALILLDLNLPGADGRAVLAKIKADDRLRAIPVVIFTTSSNPRDVQECYAGGANSYVVKGVDYAHFKRSIQLLAEYWLTVNTYPHSVEARH
jgi:CheY-like chemotaxis protein